MFPVIHPVSLATFLPSHNLFLFRFCWSFVSELGPGSPVRLLWVLLLTHPQNTLSSIRNILKGWSSWVCAIELILQTFSSQVLCCKEAKNNCFLELSLCLSLRLQHRVIRILPQLMKARGRCIRRRSNLLRARILLGVVLKVSALSYLANPGIIYWRMRQIYSGYLTKIQVCDRRM